MSYGRHLTSAIFTLLVFSSVFTQGCLGSFKKRGDAQSPIPTFDDFATLSQCPSFEAFQQAALPALTRQCASCHSGGGRGVGKFKFDGSGNTDNELVAKNFAMIVPRTRATGTFVDIDTSITLLAMINGKQPHDLNLGYGDEYNEIRIWVELEYQAQCVVDQSTGAVSAVAPSNSSP